MIWKTIWVWLVWWLLSSWLYSWCLRFIIFFLWTHSYLIIYLFSIDLPNHFSISWIFLDSYHKIWSRFFLTKKGNSQALKVWSYTFFLLPIVKDINQPCNLSISRALCSSMELGKCFCCSCVVLMSTCSECYD